MYDKGITQGRIFSPLVELLHLVGQTLHLYNIKHTGMKTTRFSLFIGMLLLLVLMGACNSGSVP